MKVPRQWADARPARGAPSREGGVIWLSPIRSAEPN
jgi:hypothetical protein